MFKVTAKKTLRTCLVVLVCLSTACTTMRPIAPDGTGDAIRREIKPGDTVWVVTNAGPAHSFQVTVVGATSLGGNAVNTWKAWKGAAPDPVGSRIDVRYSDIAELDVKRTSALKNAALVAAAVLVWVAIASNGGRHSPGFNR
jgi:hypothetical protein